MMMPAAAVFLFALSQSVAQNPASPAQAAPAPATAAISGVVIDGVTGDPVENASVSLDGVASRTLSQTRQITDAKGRFVFVNLPPAQDYALTAALPGFFTGNYTRGTGVTDSRQSIPLKVGEWARDLTIKIWRPASLTGRVVDERGDPMVGVFVRALKKAPVAGRDQLVNMTTATTDDRGVYRLTGLDSGRYVVEVPSVQGGMPPDTGAALPGDFIGPLGVYPGEASRAGSRPRAYPITFYPSARSAAEAATIDVRISEERTLGDVTLAPVPVFTVKGRLIGTTEGLTLRLMPAGLEALGNGSEASQSLIGADGAFTFENVPAGPYLVTVGRRVSELVSTLGRQNRSLPSPKGTQGFSYSVANMTAATPGLTLQQAQYGSNPRVNGRPVASPTTRMPLTVASDLSDVIVTLRAGAVMDAVVQFDPASTSSAAKPTVNQLGFWLESAIGDPDFGLLNPTVPPAAQPGAPPPTGVRFDDIGIGEFWLRSRSNTWLIKSVDWNGQDYATRPFDAASTTSFAGVTITMTDRGAAVSGTVKEKSAVVLVFPAEQSMWSNFGFNPSRIKMVMTDEAGGFSVAQLTAGDYFVLALPREDQYAWLEPGYFARVWTFATRTTLDWGEKKALSLSIARVPR
jgi:hypothetical protein